MTVKRETRSGEVRATTDQGLVEVLAVAYGVVDDYGSLWMPGVFADDLAVRMPTMAWAHDWTEPIGRAVSHREAPEGQYITFRLDIGGAVPRADQAFEQFRSETIDDVSVGFLSRERRDPTDQERIDFPGVLQVEVRADLDETSPVLRGAVPGAKLVSVRSKRTGEVVDLTAVEEIARRVVAGDIDQATADEMARLLSAPPAATPPTEVEGDEVTGDGTGEALPPTLDADDAAVIAAAEDILNRSR